MNVPRIMPFHPSYPRPQVVTAKKKEDSLGQKATFKEMLRKKMKQNNHVNIHCMRFHIVTHGTMEQKYWTTRSSSYILMPKGRWHRWAVPKNLTGIKCSAKQ